MKTFWTKKNIAIVLAVLLVAAVVVLCIALRQKSVEDTEPTLTLTCQSADADGACTVDVVLSGLPDGAHYEAASLAVAFDPTQITFLGTADGDIPLVMGSLPEWESDSERANETGSARALCLPEAGGHARHIDGQRARAAALSACRRCGGGGADGVGRRAGRCGRDREPCHDDGRAHGRECDGAAWLSGARSRCCCACCFCCARLAAGRRRRMPVRCTARCGSSAARCSRTWTT